MKDISNAEFINKEITGNYCCPKCQSTDIEYDSGDYNPGQWNPKRVCGVCNTAWVDVYKLTGYEIRIYVSFPHCNNIR